MDAALVALTGALVLTTIVYAWFTGVMAKEMRATRLLSVRPRLALDVGILGPGIGFVAVRSLGPGTAVDVRVSLTYEPAGTRRAFHAPVLAPGQAHEFYAIGAAGEKVFEFESLAAEEMVVTLRGTMRDVHSSEYEVTERLNIAEWWDVLKQADRRYQASVEERLFKELERIGKAVEKASRKVTVDP